MEIVGRIAGKKGVMGAGREEERVIMGMDMIENIAHKNIIMKPVT